MTEKPVLDDTQLEAFFDAGRAAAPVPSDALMANIMAQAVAQVSPAETPKAAPRGGLLRRIADQLGGWPALAGMASAMIAGVWIGFATPDTVTGLSGGVIGATAAFGTADLMTPNYLTLLEEG